MFRNVLNTSSEYLRRAFDSFFLFSTSNTTPTQSTTTTTTTTTLATSITNSTNNNQIQSTINSFDRISIDINNNKNNNSRNIQQKEEEEEEEEETSRFNKNNSLITSESKLIYKKKKKRRNKQRKLRSQNQSLIDEYDWFKQANKQYNRQNILYKSSSQSSLNSNSSSDSYSSNCSTESLAFESYYDFLAKFYSIDSKNSSKTKSTKSCKTKSRKFNFQIHNSTAIISNMISNNNSNSFLSTSLPLNQDHHHHHQLDTQNTSLSINQTQNLLSLDYYYLNQEFYLQNQIYNPFNLLMYTDLHQQHQNQYSNQIDTNQLMTNLNLNSKQQQHHQQKQLIKAVKLFQKTYYKEKIKGQQVNVASWRIKEKMKTVSAALVMCLNIGVDPPDVVKTTQGSKLECWINQMNQLTPQKALELIGIELQKQYERWQPRARYKHCLDPTSEDVKKLCISLRKNAKDERVLFHYNGHGVPKPTVNGEIWVFNKEFTQYIPLSLYDVQTWMASPSLYVWDCSNAGLIVQSFLQFEEDRENELINRGNDNQKSNQQNQNTPNIINQPTTATASTIATPTLTPNPSSNTITSTPIQQTQPQQSQTQQQQQQQQQQGQTKLRDSIHLAACGPNELLPQHATLPMDLFTACLTTPIKAALHWYVAQKNSCQLIPGLTIDLLENIPGQTNDRRTMMGELNWIFTAITDTIAWNVLDSDLFQKLFRQDLLVASLFRNFLLAERIMKSLDCNPVSYPSLPSTSEHPLWQSWDLALDMCISQLPYIFNTNNSNSTNTTITQNRDFVSCGFFTEQIEIFDVWLRYNVNSHSPPEQLPVVLQVLLSQQHRLKALELLAKFIDFGPWAVSAALSVGIFPYVLKLLTTQPKELRPLLTFIWAKILAVDKSCQAELVKDNGHVYFIQVLLETDVDPTQKVYSAFVLSCLVENYPTGQESAKQNHLIAALLLLTDERSRDYKNALLRQWVCICLGLCWQNYPEARWEGVRKNAHQFLIKLISDPVPEVRAAAIFALGTYIGSGQGNEATIEQTNKIDSEIVNALIKDYDIVYLVRKELIAALYNYVYQFMSQSQTQTQISSNNSSSLCSSVNSYESSSSSLSCNSSNQSSLNSIARSHSASALNNSINSNNTIVSSTSITSTNTIIQTNQTPTLNRSTLNRSSIQSNPIAEHSISIINKPSQTTTISQSQSNSSGFLSNSSSSTQLSSNQQLKRAISIEQQQQQISTAATSPNLRIFNGNQSSFLITNSNKQVNNLFVRVWNILLDMQNDPYPEVAELAQKVVSFFVCQIQNFDSLKKNHILKQIQTNATAQLFQQQINQSLNNNNQTTTIEILTEFVPWCCKYFLKPLLSTKSTSKKEETSADSDLLITNEKTDLYTSEYLDEHCKLLYNCKRRRIPSEWREPQQMDEILQIKHSNYPIHVKYHPFDEQIFVADNDCVVSVYETVNNCTKLNSFSIHNTLVKKPAITSFKLINIQHEPIVLTGTDDRVVKFFKPQMMNTNNNNNNLITAFTAFNDNQKRESTIEAGLILEWDEMQETLLCAGDTDYIRVWDMNKELYKDYLTHIKSGVFSLSTSENYTVAGFGDGTIKLFDFRRSQPINLTTTQLITDSVSGQISTTTTTTTTTAATSRNNQYLATKLFIHDSFVLKVKLHKQSNKLITAGVSGDINVFDMRSMKKALDASFNNEKATALECHSYNELIAVANSTTPNQSIKVYDFKGKELSCVKHHDGFYGKRISTVSCLDWNMHKNEIIFGSLDNSLTVFRCRN